METSETPSAIALSWDKIPAGWFFQVISIAIVGFVRVEQVGGRM